jgi:aspartyl-tRNA(Asn)/glutamyl-tRNA(Gln) amidotransferase subunit A
VHAWVVADEEGARRTAERLAGEQPRGPLHGIPIGIKDIVDVAGFPTRAGSPLREDHVAGADAPIVAALRQAGAVILGKTVTVEFACFDPSPTLNPWNTTHTPGGSSSGSAAAVAAGMCLGAIGTQTGGSLVRPSTYCGIATCKPTFGAVSLEGVVPVSYHLDHGGPMARRVGDLEIILRCLTDLPPGKASLPPRLGLLEQHFMEHASEPVRDVTEATLAILREGRATIEVMEFADGFEQVRPMHRRIMAVEAAAYHRQQFAEHRDAYGPLITELLAEGLKIPGVDYADALAWRRTYSRRVAKLLDEVDALIAPSTDTTAPATLETTGTPKFQAPWSCARLPVVSIPCGIASDGMPAAVQLVGRRHEEAALFEVANWCEQQIGFDEVPPMLR